MTLNDTPSANRLHIIVLGACNSGKSSVVNLLASQQVSLVSDIAGTTTDPVRKAMELRPYLLTLPVLMTTEHSDRLA